MSQNIQQMSEMTPPYKVEIFTEAELMFNVTRHKVRTAESWTILTGPGSISGHLLSSLLPVIFPSKMVPKHEVLTEEEKRILLERYNLTADNLPRMQKEDAIARYFGLDIGQVSGRELLFCVVCQLHV